jgi:hypothetical protein
MSRHIFLSHSHLDRPVADLVLTGLEERGIRCWVAPRDVLAGGSYAASIVDAIEAADGLILIYTKNCNTSPHVLREVERALQAGINIIPIRFDDSIPSKSLNYLLATVHWLSVSQDSREIDVAKAVDRIARTLDHSRTSAEATHLKVPLAPQVGTAFPGMRDMPSPLPSNRNFLIVGGVVVFVTAAAFWYALWHESAPIRPVVTQSLEKSVSPTTTASSAPTGASQIELTRPPPVATPFSTPTPEVSRTPLEVVAVIPTPPLPQPKAEGLPLKGSWAQVVKQTKSHTLDVNTARLVVDGNKFVFTRTTKSTLRSDARPREAPKGVQGYTHVTRYTGNVIFANQEIIKIKLLTVDFPMRYPSWVAGAKQAEQKDADYARALAVWTLRRAGEDLVDAEEPSTILRLEK